MGAYQGTLRRSRRQVANTGVPCRHSSQSRQAGRSSTRLRCPVSLEKTLASEKAIVSM